MKALPEFRDQKICTPNPNEGWLAGRLVYSWCDAALAMKIESNISAVIGRLNG
jgi:hypothetical protein